MNKKDMTVEETMAMKENERKKIYNEYLKLVEEEKARALDEVKTLAELASKAKQRAALTCFIAIVNFLLTLCILIWDITGGNVG